MAIEAVRVQHDEKRRFEVRFWLFTVFVVLALVFRRWFAARSGSVVWPQTMTTNMLTDLATAFGMILAIQSRRVLGQNWSSEVVILEKHELVERGPYAYIRHPLYSGLLLMLMGVALYYGRKGWIIIFVCSFFGFYFKSQMEERRRACSAGKRYHDSLSTPKRLFMHRLRASFVFLECFWFAGLSSRRIVCSPPPAA